MARAIIDTTSGAGDTLKAGGDKINAMTAELFGKADALLGGRKARIATIGNSHSTRSGLAQAIMYSLWRYYPADVYFDYRTSQDQAAFDPARGDIFGIGGTTTAQMVSTQLPKFQAAIAAGRVYDLLYIADGGYNDQYASAAGVATGVGNIITVANAALAAGVKLVVILGVLPASPGTGAFEVASWCAEANQQLRNFAAATSGVAFQEVTSIFADHNNPSLNLNKRLGNVYLGFSSDGTHLAGYGARLLSPELAKYHQAVARRRFPRSFGNTGTFDAVNRPSVNVLGNAGNVQGTAGLKQSSFNTGVAGVDANSRLVVTDAGTANNVATPSIITDNPDGFYRQRITMSGGAPATGVIYLSATVSGIPNINGGVTSRGYDVEAVVELTGVTGLADIFLRTHPGNATDTPTFGNGSGGVVSDLWPDNTTETLFVYSTVPQTYAANTAVTYPFSIFFGFNNRIPSGTIDVSRMSFQRVAD